MAGPPLDGLLSHTAGWKQSHAAATAGIPGAMSSYSTRSNATAFLPWPLARTDLLIDVSGFQITANA